jgi:DNA-binding beta-propeller fold protein YncE
VFDLDKKGRTSLWGRGGQGALNKPTGVTSDKQGNIYVSDSLNKRIVVFDKNGNFVRAFGGKDILELPAGLAFSEKAQKLYVVDTKKHQVSVFNKDGNLDSTIGANGTNPGFFNFPTNIAIDSNGRLYIADSMNFRIQVLEEDGTYVRHIGQVGQRIGDFFRLKGVGVDTDGNVYGVDASFSNFQVFNQQGQLLIYIGSGGSGRPGKFALPAGMHVDNNNRIFVADQYNQRIQMFEFLGGGETPTIE